MISLYSTILRLYTSLFGPFYMVVGLYSPVVYRRYNDFR